MSKRISLKQYAFIGIGGVIGAVARYSISLLFAVQSGFPYPTLLVNLIGCFLLSFLMNHQIVRQKLREDILIAINTGMIGSFTTFSTFSVETVTLWIDYPLMATIYVVLSVILGLLFCYVGYQLATRRQVES